MLQVDVKTVPAAAPKAYIYLPRFAYAKFCTTPQSWVAQHVAHSSCNAWLLVLSLNIYASYPPTIFCLPLLSPLPHWWVLSEPEQPMPWSPWWCVVIDEDYKNGRQGTICARPSLNPSCQDSDIRIQLQTRCIFIRIVIGAHFSSTCRR